MAEDSPAQKEQEQLDDHTLVDRIVQGDKEALSVLYDRYVRLVYSLSIRIVEKPGVAEEVTQDVFMTLWSRGSSYKSERGPFSAWLLSITHNRSIDELRKSRRQAKLPTVEIDEAFIVSAGGNDQVPDIVLAQVDREHLLGVMEKIPAAQKQVIFMAYFQGLTQSEISQSMGAPLGTIKTRMRLGLQKMRELLTSEGRRIE